MEKLKSGSRAVMQMSILLAMLYFTSYITRLNFSAVMNEMIAASVLDKTQAGAIGSALFFTYGFGQIVSGMLSDKFSPNAIIGAGLGITVICNLLMPVVENPVLMAVVWAFNGFAQALFWPPIVAIMAESFDENQYATGTLVVSIGSHGATILIYALVPLFLVWFSWRSSFFFAAIWAVFFAAVWFLLYPKFKKDLGTRAENAEEQTGGVAKTEREEKHKKKGFFKLLLSSGVIVILVAIAMQGFLKDGIQSWMPTFFTEVFQMETSAAILSNMVLPIFNIVVVWVATSLYKKVFRHETREAIILFAVAAVLCVLLAMFYESSALLCLLLAATITGCMHGINLMLVCFVPRRFHRQGKVATVTGICNACSYVGSTVSSYGIAATAEALGWKNTLISWGAVALVGLALCIVITRRWTKFAKENA